MVGCCSKQHHANRSGTETWLSQVELLGVCSQVFLLFKAYLSLGHMSEAEAAVSEVHTYLRALTFLDMLYDVDKCFNG